MNDAHLFPLEKLLKEASSSYPLQFPTQENYFERYMRVKDWLKLRVYPHIGSGLSKDGGIYTSHGEDHFDQVIRYAGHMVGAEEPNCLPARLKPYETYVLLMAILLHDAGNLYGREGHEKKAFELLNDMGELSGSDNVEKRAIAEVAEAHGGRTAAGDKDTIRNVSEERHHGDVTFRGRMLAGVLRFADEICEHRGRECRVLLKREILPKMSEVYHVYAESITAVRVERQGKTVNIEYDIRSIDATRLWGKDSGEVYLTDEVLHRLEKMNLERIYCGRFMYPLFVAERIKVTIKILDENWQVLEEFPIKLEDPGYPSLSSTLADTYPELGGKIVSHRLTRKTES